MMRAPGSNPAPTRLAVGPGVFSGRSLNGHAYALRSCRRILPWVARRQGQGGLSQYSNLMMGFANEAEGCRASDYVAGPFISHTRRWTCSECLPARVKDICYSRLRSAVTSRSRVCFLPRRG